MKPVVHFEEDTSLLAEDGDGNFLSDPLTDTDSKNFNFKDNKVQSLWCQLSSKNLYSYYKLAFIEQWGVDLSGNKGQYERTKKNGEYLP